MWYMMLEGRFKVLLGHHFTLLNHFRHGLFIFFPFFLLSSLESFVYAHLKNRRALILHEGPILLIMEHVQSITPVPAITGKGEDFDALSGWSDSESSSDEEEEWNEDEVGVASRSRKRKVAGSKINRAPKRLAIFGSEDTEVGSDGFSPRA